MKDQYTVSQGLKENILGEIVYNEPWLFEYHFQDGTTKRFPNVVKLQAMKTGCTVLHCKVNSAIAVISPGYKYVVEGPMSEWVEWGKKKEVTH